MTASNPREYYDTLEMVLQDEMGINATFSNDLENMGRDLYGKNFIGVFSSDTVPNLTRNNMCCLVNTDSSRQSGTHWCALYQLNNKTYFFDSFGRDYTKLSKYWINKNWFPVLTSEKYRTQSFSTSDCGPQSLAFIGTFKKYGVKTINNI